MSIEVTGGKYAEQKVVSEKKSCKVCGKSISGNRSSGGRREAAASALTEREVARYYQYIDKYRIPRREVERHVWTPASNMHSLIFRG
jgi:hypothetical protein